MPHTPLTIKPKIPPQFIQPHTQTTRILSYSYVSSIGFEGNVVLGAVSAVGCFLSYHTTNECNINLRSLHNYTQQHLYILYHNVRMITITIYLKADHNRTKPYRFTIIVVKLNDFQFPSLNL